MASPNKRRKARQARQARLEEARQLCWRAWESQCWADGSRYHRLYVSLHSRRTTPRVAFYI